MKLISWNVNGIRAVLKKGFLDWLKAAEPDILCLQETKAHYDVLPPELKVYDPYTISYCSGIKKGYSGVSTWSIEKTRDINYGFGLERRFDEEGRILHTVYEKFELLNIYFPNGNKDEERLQYKMDFYDACLSYCNDLVSQNKKLVICGDVNTCHNEIDLARPKENSNVSGFLPIERAWVDRFISEGYVDTFRHFHPDEAKYSWWSMRTAARERNIGWRLDYFFVSENLLDKVIDSTIDNETMGSDHCPIILEMEF